MKSFGQKVLTILSFLFFITSLVLLKFDGTFYYRWVVLYLHFSSLTCLTLLWMSHMYPDFIHFFRRLRTSSLPLLILCTFALCTRFLFLQSYPFVSLGDEVRDGGLQAQQIATGTLKNIFAFGRYDAHGLIIPTITSFFYKVFGPSILVYRVSAALLSVFSIFFLYLLLLMRLNSTAAFFGTLAFTTLPIHMFYARTEVVVMFSIFLSTINLFFLSLYLKKPTPVMYVFFITILGFASQFHTSVRIESLFILLFLIGHQLLRYLKNKPFIRYFVIIAVIFWFIGFGPRILFTTPKIFFQMNRLPYLDNKISPSIQWNKLQNIPEKYMDTLRVWFDRPTTAWYPDHKPILTPFFFLFFVLGILISITTRIPFYLMVVLLVVLLSFTNSAMTDMVNGDHRLSPLYPAACILIALGFSSFLTHVKHNVLRYLVMAIFFVLCGWQLIQFFIQQPANKIRTIGDYVSMHAIYGIRTKLWTAATADPSKEKILCLISSKRNIDSWHILHAIEQKQYFLPNVQIILSTDLNMKDNAVSIRTISALNPACGAYGSSLQEVQVQCNRFSYLCPKGYTDTISLFYEPLL